MPIYEYCCGDCGRVSAFLVLNLREPFQPQCKSCQGEKMTRLISRVARVRSEERRMESLADPSRLAGLDEKDPASMARWMKRMGKELGEDMGEDFGAMMDEVMKEEGKTRGEGSGGPDEDL